MAHVLTNARVAVVTGPGHYGGPAPYGPEEPYPEYPWPVQTIQDGANPAYEAVRQALRLLDLDARHFGTPRWNPLGRLIRPGQTVVLKPNFVRDFRETQPGDGDCLITHGAIIRAVADYAWIALGRRGRLIVADAPQNDADFAAIRRITRLDAIQTFYRRVAGLELEVYDLRPEAARKVDGVIVGHEELPGDPAGYVTVDLGSESAFAEIEALCKRLYGSEYDTREIRSHHTGGRHEYLVSRTVLQADCVISLPKLKTHKKTGLTANMKNLVGINGNKNWLPHHREGTPRQGGDQFADDGWVHRLERGVMRAFRRGFPLLGPVRQALARPLKGLGRRAFGDTNTDTVRSDNWYGNDTTWRMVTDLNRLLLYANLEGRLQRRPVRQFFSVVDGIVAGEGNGPLDAWPKSVGVVVAGLNPVAVDLACARLMGFDWRRLPLLARALEFHPHPLGLFDWIHVRCASNDVRFDRPAAAIEPPALSFLPHFGWAGHVEVPIEPAPEDAPSPQHAPET